MTYPPNCTLPPQLAEPVASEGLDALPELIRLVINAAMQAERQKHLGVEQPCERSAQRRGQANGFKPKTVKTRVGEITFAVPQVREGGFCAHEGLGVARRTVFGGVPWQRCQFHLQQHASAYVPREELKAEVAADTRAIFHAPNRHEADPLLTKTVLKYAFPNEDACLRLASAILMEISDDWEAGKAYLTFKPA